MRLPEPSRVVNINLGRRDSEKRKLWKQHANKGLRPFLSHYAIDRETSLNLSKSVISKDNSEIFYNLGNVKTSTFFF